MQSTLKQIDMIKASELRIGNLVLFDDEEIKEVTLTMLRFIVNSERLGQLIPFSPIELTEEWLIKLGFKYSEDKGFNSNYDEYYRVYSIRDFDIALINGSFNLWLEMEEDKYYNFSWTRIKYVHQLQNLYFALTGQELIKPSL